MHSCPKQYDMAGCLRGKFGYVKLARENPLSGLLSFTEMIRKYLVLESETKKITFPLAMLNSMINRRDQLISLPMVEMIVIKCFLI